MCSARRRPRTSGDLEPSPESVSGWRVEGRRFRRACRAAPQRDSAWTAPAGPPSSGLGRFIFLPRLSALSLCLLTQQGLLMREAATAHGPAGQGKDAERWRFVCLSAVRTLAKEPLVSKGKAWCAQPWRMEHLDTHPSVQLLMKCLI